MPLVGAVDHDRWDPQFVGYPIATFCALYALTAWTPPRRFVVGFTLVVAVYLAASIGGGSKNGVTFMVVTAIVMLLVRRVVGDRERRARVAERKRTSTGRRRSSRSAHGSRASSTTRSRTTCR